ncbi:hypothetical protein HPB47_019482 [Ixodes persulcatus]|uniref:Uncharacterized protein n=1 Tax=Ixodes persulcatus TaxID=34615 RepID=A0AC60QI27_IXOPE|nr:hypothetical protein HPB47_019482 [Ixodes persulcatus]
MREYAGGSGSSNTTEIVRRESKRHTPSMQGMPLPPRDEGRRIATLVASSVTRFLSNRKMHEEAKATLDACGIVTDQPSLTRKGSDSHLVFYVARHLLRKCIRKTNCREALNGCSRTQQPQPRKHA